MGGPREPPWPVIFELRLKGRGRESGEEEHEAEDTGFVR